MEAHAHAHADVHGGPGSAIGTASLPKLDALLDAAVLALALATGAAGVVAFRTRSRLSAFQEARTVGLKGFRVGMYGVLAAVQAPALGPLLRPHAWPPSVADMDQAACLLTWLLMLGLLLVGWRRQGAMPMLVPALLSLSLGLLVLLADTPVMEAMQDAHQQAPGDVLVRLVSHAVQTVLLFSVMMGELVMAQHVWSQLRGEPDPMLTPLKPVKPGKQGPTGLPEDGRAIIMAPLRWRMAASAFKYVLPSGPQERVRLLMCFLLVAAERFVNLAVPVLFKQMVDQLSKVSALHALGPYLLPLLRTGGAGGLEAAGGDGAPGAEILAALPPAAAPSVAFWDLFYPAVFFYLGFYFLRGGSGAEGLLANVRDLLWIPITQAAYRNVSLDVFGHLLMLDHQFHMKRKTGQIMRILDRGTSSIQDTVSIVLFNVLPQIADIGVACTYLAVKMQPFAATIVFVTVASYIPLTVVITERRGKIRKIMNMLDNAREGRATDMLLNYETVKFFCNEALELKGYDTSLRQYQGAEYWQMAFLAMLAMVQGTVVWLGLVFGLVVCVRGVAAGTLTIGDTVLFVTMINQLYIPLTYFGSYYRQVQKALIDMENMFELINTVPQVQDPPGGNQLVATVGAVTFDNVVFRYKASAPAVLKGVSFHVPGGRTLAVVGSTGSGKSTVLRLLLRFYDVQQGSVRVDGVDVRAVTQHSLRSAIAVVPQDCMLFNDTVLHNIRYGRVNATDEEVVEAAAVAHIHESIETKFKKRYDTKVGERGLRLSGGEKQRVAFARAVLKRPAILVLDEATSALDSITEQQIQDSLRQMRRRCTTVIVAHRLSTIMDADIILVLDRGRVAEQGSHVQLIEQGGLYARMWSRQRHMMDIDIPAAMDAVQDASDAYAGGSDRGCDDSDDGGEGNGDGEGEGNAAGTPKPRGGVGNAKRILRGRTPAAETTEAEDTDCAGSDHGSPQERGSGSVAAALARPLATLPPVACSPREALASPGRSTLHAGSTANPKSRPPSGSVQLRPAGSRGVPSNVPGRRASPPIREASDPGDGGDEHETEAEGADGDADSQVAAATRPTATSAMLAIPAAGRAAAAAATVAERPLGWSRSESVDDLNRHPSPARLRIMTRLGLADHSSSFPSVAPSDIEDSEDDARSLAAASGRFAASGSTVARTTPMRAATADTDAVDVTAAAFRGARQVTGQRARASARPGARSGHGNAAYDDGLSAPLLPVWSGDVEEGEGPGPRPQGSSGR